MITILKMIIWVVGFVVVAGFVLNYFGYEINKNYFLERKADCAELLKDCQSKLIHQGIDNAKCEYNCVNPRSVIIKK